MTELEAYLQFRKEIDTMCYMPIRKLSNITKELDEKGNVIAFIITQDGYIDSLWVDKKYRGNGLGYRLVIRHILEVGMPETLRILNNNYNAVTFWNKVFELERLESNSVDSLYLILKLKESKS